MAWSVVLLVDFWWSPCNFVMSHFNVMLLKSQECMYVYVSIVVPIYLCMYACMRVCMYACMHVCMYVCMHASCIYDDRLFGGAHETAMGGWEMAAGASRAQESQVRRKLPGGLGKGRACGWSCKSVQDVVGPNECLFVCPKPCFLFMAQPGPGGREGDSLGEWWVGAGGREMGTVALGWVAGPVHAAAQSKQASKESRVEMWHFCC